MKWLNGSVLAVWMVLAALGRGGGLTTAAEFHVDPGQGSDACDGLAAQRGAGLSGPFATINRALKAAGGGDTIHLAPGERPYPQTADFYGHPGGSPGNPLVLDGHGAMLTGADDCPAEGWTLYRDTTWMRRDRLSAGFLLVEGRMVPATRNADVLQPGEICFDPLLFNRLFLVPPTNRAVADLAFEVGMPDGSVRRLEPGQWHPGGIGATRRCDLGAAPAWVRLDGREVPLVRARDRLPENGWTLDDRTLYLRPPAGKSPKDLALACLVRANGVQMSGTTAHVRVRNLNVRHVHNDGFNIHGRVTDAEFSNCNARQCGDEGFSAHDACETTLDGAVYEECDNGIANVNTSGWSVTRHAIVRGSRSVGYLLETKGTAHHVLRDSIFIDNPSQLKVGDVEVENVLVLRSRAAAAPAAALSCGRNTRLRALTAAGNTTLLRADAQSTVRLERCLLAAGQTGLHVRADDPASLLEFAAVRFGPGLWMEWGTRYPWKRQPLEDWLLAAAATGKVKEATVEDLSALDALRDGRRPAPRRDGLGCDSNLLERAVRFIETEEARFER